MSKFTLLLPFILLLSISPGFAANKAKPRIVPTASEIPKNTNSNSPVIAFVRFMFDVPPSESLGTYCQNLCLLNREFVLDSQTFELTEKRYFDAFYGILNNANYNTLGEVTDVFRSRDEKAEYLVAAVLKDFEIEGKSAEDERGRFRGQLNTVIEWQFYSVEKEEIVFRKDVESYAKIDKYENEGVSFLLQKSMEASVYNLMADEETQSFINSDKITLVNPDFDNLLIDIITTGTPEVQIPLSEATSSVVTIKNIGAHGSGFIISQDGYILTNQHVVGASETVTVALNNGIEIDGQVVRTAEFRDVALVKIPIRNLKPLPLKMTYADIGTEVYAIGAPIDTELRGSISSGIVSTYRRNTEEDQTYLQSDAIVNGGNSGGPLITKNGQVVAITVAKHAGGEGISYFIPIDSALKTLNIAPPVNASE